MTNDTIGIIGVFAFTGLLFILRQLIVTVAMPRKRVTIVTTPPEAQGALHREDFQVKEELEQAQAQHAMAPSFPGSFPRFPI
jgi:hypothetical protein